MAKPLIAVVLLALVAYGGVKAWPLIAGPSIVIDSPAENAIVPGGVVAIRGRAEHASRLSLNGAPLLRDTQGNFSTMLAFPDGGSTLVFSAADRFGRETRAERSVLVPAAEARVEQTKQTEQATTTNQ